MVKQRLLLSDPVAALLELCFELGIIFVHSDDALLRDARFINLHGSTFLVSSIFEIVPGILYLLASGNACPLLSFALVGFFH